MTSKAITRTQEVGSVERFPDFPPRDDMQNWLFLYDSATLTALTIHFADLPNTTVASEVPVGRPCPTGRIFGYRTCWWLSTPTAGLSRSSADTQ